MEKDYLEQMKQASKTIEAVLAQHPEFDRDDLYHIYLRLQLSPEERLRKGLRRRVIYGGTYTLD